MADLFNSVISTESTTTITVWGFVLCVLAALVFGIIIAIVFQYKNVFTKSFIMSIAILPAVVCVVIMMVNGSIGAGIAVAGAFSLIRFRSVPGTAKEISAIFIAMATGLACGMGYIGYGLLFTVIISIVVLILEKINFGVNKSSNKNQIFRITIPEDLDYINVFDDLFIKYANKSELQKVKTTNMGSMYKLTYSVELKNNVNEKEFIDELRTRNGNLEISSSIEAMNTDNL